QQESEAAPIGFPRRCDRIDDLAKLVVLAEEEVARLRKTQRQQIGGPPAQDERIAFGSEERVPGQPRGGRGKVRVSSRRCRKRAGTLDSLRDRRKRVRGFCQDAGAGTDRLRPDELRMI